MTLKPDEHGKVEEGDEPIPWAFIQGNQVVFESSSKDAVPLSDLP